jgi:hypothetical protein
METYVSQWLGGGARFAESEESVRECVYVALGEDM